jgi:heme A synthase
MKRSERNSAYFIFTSTALSGISIWALKRWGVSPGPFGPIQHHLLDEMHLIHNLFNLLFLGMFGWLSAVHIRAKLKSSKERKTTGVLLIFLFVLVPLTGQLLLYLSQKEVLEVGRQVHLILGLVAMILFYFHSRNKKALSY